MTATSSFSLQGRAMAAMGEQLRAEREKVITLTRQLHEALANHAAAHQNWMTVECLAAKWSDKHEAAAQAIIDAEWAGDPGTDPNSFVCPFCGIGHSEQAWVRGERHHAAGCIVPTLTSGGGSAPEVQAHAPAFREDGQSPKVADSTGTGPPSGL